MNKPELELKLKLTQEENEDLMSKLEKLYKEFNDLEEKYERNRNDAFREIMKEKKSQNEFLKKALFHTISKPIKRKHGSKEREHFEEFESWTTIPEETVSPLARAA